MSIAGKIHPHMRRSTLKRAAAHHCPAAVCLASAAALLAGCLGYRLGTTLPPDIRSIAVPTFVNRTAEPMLEVETTNKTISEFQKDGTLKIRDISEADAVLEVTIRKVELTPLRYSATDKVRPNEYRMTLTAAYKLRRLSDDRVIGESSEVTGETTFPYSGDMMSAKRMALPDAAEDLGRAIATQVVETW